MQRSGSERLAQSLAFEAGGLVLAVPLYQALFGRGQQDSLLLMVTLALVVLLWNPLHNRMFDATEHRLTGRTASNRPHWLRLAHAVSHELSPMAVTTPLIMGLGGHGLAEALAVNLGLTALYVGYAYAFYLTYDRLLPIRAEATS